MDEKSSHFILLLVFIILLQVTACKDSGSVGDSIGESNSEFTIDTLQIPGVRIDTLNAFSGNLPFFSAGRFNDPLFGDVKATGLIKPTLASNSGNTIFDDNTKMRLKLAIHKQTVYGDTLAGETFNIVELGKLFRGPSSKIKDTIQLTGSSLVSFTVSDQDTVEVPLPPSFVQKYGQYYNQADSTGDSTYARHFYGLALVPQNSAKIVTIDASECRFITTHINNKADTTKSDSIGIPLRDYAYSLNRSNVPSGDSETTKIYNTLERIFTFNYDFSSDNIEPLNVAKIELVIKRDDLLLNDSIEQSGANAARPAAETLHLHYVKGDELPQSIDPGNPLTLNGGAYNEDDNAYHFDLTNLIKNRAFDSVDSTRTFYITLGSNNGVIQSSLVFNNQAGKMAPKLIISSINNR